MPRSTLVLLGLLVTVTSCTGGGLTETAQNTPEAPAGGAFGVPGDLTTAETYPGGAGGSEDGAAPVPEPTTILLLGTGLLAVARFRRRRPQVV